MKVVPESRVRSSVWLLGFPIVLLIHLVWHLLNDTPPAWDMAFHQLKGWLLLESLEQGGPLHGLWSISYPYPPLYHWTEALILWVLGDTRLLPFMANLPGLGLLSYGTYRVGRYYLAPAQAGWAGVLVLLFPMVAWISRESLLDVQLAGWVAMTGFLVLRSKLLVERRWVLLLGLACAGGMLTKWTFPVYVVVPILYGLLKSPERFRSFLNLFIAGLLALPLVLVYYGPNFALLASNYPTTDQDGLIPWLPYPRHGEPGLNNYLGWIYYPRVLASYFLFLPLTLLFSIGVFLPRDQSRTESDERTGFLWFWLVGGIVLLTFVTPKDPRFAIPLVTPVSILLVRFWRKYQGVVGLIVALSILQFLLVSFSFPLTLPKLSLLSSEKDRDFQTIQREWVFFQPEYFGITGPPRQENWRWTEILTEIPEEAVVGVLPELPRFNVNGLHLRAAKEGRRVEAFALGNLDDWETRLETLDYVVSKSDYQGLSFITRFNNDINGALDSGNWATLGEWSLPDGSTALLLRNPVP